MFFKKKKIEVPKITSVDNIPMAQNWTYIPTQQDYLEELDKTSNELEELKQKIKQFAEEIKETDPEFEKTFKKKFREILA